MIGCFLKLIMVLCYLWGHWCNKNVKGLKWLLKLNKNFDFKFSCKLIISKLQGSISISYLFINLVLFIKVCCNVYLIFDTLLGVHSSSSAEGINLQRRVTWKTLARLCRFWNIQFFRYCISKLWVGGVSRLGINSSFSSIDGPYCFPDYALFI